ncbi:hypothetical protein HMN09_01179500 [Mycena chlorophos]|uniref:Uncharacterized protein n=1 Tax=Mycena chlorophos TaxID=658473 RepID=A0A8H6VVW4_MYCCL|nr:hypothetical protein HMN09_01179500 [Mycena chlorophos]
MAQTRQQSITGENKTLTSAIEFHQALTRLDAPLGHLASYPIHLPCFDITPAQVLASGMRLASELLGSQWSLVLTATSSPPLPTTLRLNMCVFLSFSFQYPLKAPQSSDSDTHEYSPGSSPTPEQRMLAEDRIGATKLFQIAPLTPDITQHDPLAGATRVDSPFQATPDHETSAAPVCVPRDPAPEGIQPAYFNLSLLQSLPADFVRALGRNRAQECLSCEYIEVHDTYFLYAQFRLGGYVGSAFNDSISPRGILRVWAPASGDPEPWWVELRNGAATPRVVLRDTAVGRSMLMSKVIHNAAIARELALWAQKFHPHPSMLADADPALLRSGLPEDDPEYDDTEVMKEI